MSLALLEGAVVFTVALAGALGWGQPTSADQWLAAAAQAAALCACCLVAFYYNDLYDLRAVRAFGLFAGRLPQSLGLALLLLAVGCKAFPEARMEQRSLLTSLIAVPAALLAFRAATYRAMRRPPFIERVLMLGASPLARQILEHVQAQPRSVVVGVAELDPSCGPPSRQLARLLEEPPLELQPDRIIVALAVRRGQLPVRELLEYRVRGIVVEDGVDAYERLTGKLAIESLPPSSLLFSRDFQVRRAHLALARALSLVAAAFGLFLSAPLLALIVLAIKLDSRGPVLFVQKRVGLFGRQFGLLKFRTMRPAGTHRSEWVRDNGDRITRVGAWLRKFRLDELPQFWNVLRGDMNLVGPRPHPVANFRLFVENIPYYSLRSAVRPGITGWAQVRYGYANDLEEETEKMRYDLYYIKHMSLWLDLRILFDTVKIVLLGRESRALGARRLRGERRGGALRFAQGGMR